MNEIQKTLQSLPKPSRDQALYDAVLDSGFRKYPERLKNYKKFKAAERGENLDYLPIMLDIENVSRCNYKCTMCPVSDWEKGTRARDMEFEEFRQLIDDQEGLTEIKLQGLGEPTMGKSYIEMIEYARSRHLWVRSSTNASRLHIKDTYKRIIDADICELQISMDGASANTYETIRPGGKFNKVVENNKLINEYAVKQNKHRTRMWTVVQRDNYAELERFPEFAEELGFNRLTLSFDLNNWGQERWEKHNEIVDVHHKLTCDQGFELVEKGKQLGVEVSFWFIDEKFSTDSIENLCPWPFQRAYISSDMRVVPCCMMANPEVMDLGDAAEFSNVWNDVALSTFRRQHIEGQIPVICRSCYKKNDF